MENYKRYLGKKIGHLFDENPNRFHYTEEQVNEWLDYERICCRKTMYNIRKGKTNPSDELLDMICRKIGETYTDDERVYQNLYEAAQVCKNALQQQDYSSLYSLKKELELFDHKEYILCQDYWLVLKSFISFIFEGTINEFQKNEGRFHFRDIFNGDFNDLLDFMSVYRMILHGGKDDKLTILLKNPIFTPTDHRLFLCASVNDKRVKAFYIENTMNSLDTANQPLFDFYQSVVKSLNDMYNREPEKPIVISMSRNRKRNMKKLVKESKQEQIMNNLPAILQLAQDSRSYKLVYDYLVACTDELAN